MRRRIIFFLCILFVIFNIEGTTAENDQNVSIIITTPSSITLKWDMGHDFMDKLVKVIAYYRPRELIPPEPTLHYNQANGSYYEVKYPDYDKFYYSWHLSTLWPGSKEVEAMLKESLIRIDNIKYPGIEYDILIDRTENGTDIFKSFMTKARTLPAIPKSSVGSFRVGPLRNSARMATIYWQWSEGTYQMDAMDVSEEKERVKWRLVSHLDSGYTDVIIGLKRHNLDFKSYHTGSLETFLFVSVPAYCDSVQVPPITVLADKNNDTLLSIQWQKPEYLNVDNYTLFLISSNDGKEVGRILDLVHLDGNETSFKMKRTNLGLAMSVNTKSGSTGIQFIPLQ